MGQKELVEKSDDDFEKEMEEMDKEIEEELGEELTPKAISGDQIEEITKLQDELRDKIPMEKLLGYIKKKYDAEHIENLTEEQGDDVLSQIRHIKEKYVVKQEQTKAKVVEAEVEEEQKWDKTVEIDEGEFSFREEEGKLLCRDGANGNVYELDVKKPHCPCGDFEINKQKQEWCKHLKAAAALKYPVKELPKVPAVITKELEKMKPEKKRREKVKKEEVVAIEVLGKRVDLVVQTPQEIIQNEEMAAEMIKTILGPNPKREDVIEEYGNIEEVAADVIISMAQYAGIRFQPFNKEIEVTKMNLGKVFKAIPMSKDKKEQYEALADFMPDTDVTTRCKITSIAGWLDKKGDLHFGMGTKEEHLTPYKLKDIATRGANFIETMCESKSAKKSILGCLPITHDGLKSKIKTIYQWE